MDKKGLLELSGYNEYANDLLFGVAKKLTSDELTRPSSPSHGSVLGLLRHVFDVEAFFLFVCQGRPLAPGKDGTLSFEQFLQEWAGLAKGRMDYLNAVSEADLDGKVEPFGPGLAYTRSQLLVQSLVHSIHHRGELSIVMTGLGHPLPTLDIILHFTKQNGQEWPTG
jgi:uncharacterized damage-inducible protein DinB